MPRFDATVGWFSYMSVGTAGLGLVHKVTGSIKEASGNTDIVSFSVIHPVDQ
jgi:hypothetical protein